MLNDLVERFDVTNRVEDAQVIVINTCAFINDALKNPYKPSFDRTTERTGVENNCRRVYVKRYGKFSRTAVDAIVDTANCLNISKAIRDSYKRICFIHRGGFDIDYLNKRIMTDLPYEYIKLEGW